MRAGRGRTARPQPTEAPWRPWPRVCWFDPVGVPGALVADALARKVEARRPERAGIAQKVDVRRPHAEVHVVVLEIVDVTFEEGRAVRPHALRVARLPHHLAQDAPARLAVRVEVVGVVVVGADVGKSPAVPLLVEALHLAGGIDVVQHRRRTALGHAVVEDHRRPAVHPALAVAGGHEGRRRPRPRTLSRPAARGRQCARRQGVGRAARQRRDERREA